MSGRGLVPSGWGRRFTFVGGHVLLIACVLGLWAGYILVADVSPRLLPMPGTVIEALGTQLSDSRSWEHIATTTREILLGFVLGCGGAFLLGLLVAQSNLLERVLAPLVVGLETIPKIALAPLFVVWFGFGLTSKVVTTAIICFFPMFINVSEGLKVSTPEQIEMMRAAGAGRFALLWRLRLPNAMPLVFAALKICFVLAVAGAVVAEYVGASSGLGYQLLTFSRQMRTAEMFANIIILALIGLIGHLIIRLIQRTFFAWTDSSAAS